jgi:hypothetical protein
MIAGVNDQVRRRLPVALYLLAAIGLAVAIASLVSGRRAPRVTSAGAPVAIPVLSSPPGRPFLMYVSLSNDETFKRVVLAPLNAPDGARYVTPLNCERVYYSGSRGLCLETRSTGPDATTHLAHVFDEHFTRRHTMVLTGSPSRTRLSPDGRRAAFTVFDEGHSYADGIFSTRTTIIDTLDGTAIGDLESWKVTRDGKPFANRDFNFWGVTFGADGNRFYATLRTQGTAYLIEGDVDAREARVLLQGAECPSLSPDQRRLAFKRRVGGSQGWWQIALFDLQTRAVRLLSGETQSVDDQVEWLDAGSLIYFRPSTAGNIIWRLSADAAGPPQPFVHAGFSPAVVR